MDVKATVNPLHEAITPYGLAKLSDGYFLIAQKHSPKSEHFLVPTFLYVRSIELGIKSALLSIDCTKNNKYFLEKEVRHDLKLALDVFDDKFEIFDNLDKCVILDINEAYKKKGLEYFTIDMLGALVSGMKFKSKKLPELSKIKTVAEKLNSFLCDNKHFISCKPLLDREGKALINLY